MTDSMQQYANAVLFSFIGVVAFLICVASGMFGYKLWSTRHFYLKDFERVSTEAKALSLETMRIRRDVNQDENAVLSITIANLEIIGAADEWDTGIRIALAAWDDIMQPGEGALDVESGKGDKLLKQRRKSHGRYVVGLMRTKCMEGLERRKELSPQMQRLHVEVMSREVNGQASQLGRC
jgi:hypothetical protein